MALTGLHTNWEKGSYVNDRDWKLKFYENYALLNGDLSGLLPHWDGGTSLAIGYGFDLIKNSTSDINTYLTAVNGQTTTLTDADIKLLNDARASIAAKTADATYLQGVANQLSISLVSEAAATSLLQIKLALYESALDVALGDSSQLLQSKERIAVLSLLYTMTDTTASSISKKIPKTILAIQNDNRAEAWFEIRYNSNSDGQHATRRYAESDLFGLYDTAGTTTEAEAKEIMRMYTRHQTQETDVTKTIQYYEQQYSPSASGTNTITNNILPAYNYLVTNFAPGKTIDNVIVGAGLDSYAYLEPNPNDIITGTDKNDLIFGEKGNDILSGGAGSDVIYGGQGNDILWGDAGNDLLEGDAGFDRYNFYTGDGKDVITDSDGSGVIFYDGNIVASGLHKNSDPADTWQGEHGETLAKAGNDLIISKQGQTDSITVKDYFSSAASNPLGINLTNETDYLNGWSTQTITGTSGDDTIAALASGYNYTIYGGDGSDIIDPPGNDIIYGQGGDDYIWGGAGDDRIYGGDGNDFLVGDNNSANVTDGQDYIEGNEGNDTIMGGFLDDILIGGAGDDTIYGEYSQYNVQHLPNSADTQDDYIDGGEGNDTLYGGGVIML